MVERRHEDTAYEASRQAAIALARMDSHVIECAGRYTEVREALTAVRSSVTRLHERMDANFATRQEQYEQTRRDNKMNFFALALAVGGWIIALVIHFWK